MLVFPLLPAIADDWLTYYEKSNYTRTPRYKETINYCQKLANASSMIHYTTFGKSPQGRDLPLLIVDKNGNFTPETVRETDNVVFFIQAGIHSGEIDGKDAGLMLIRDIVIKKKLQSLLDHVTLLFCPIFNVDGHERFSPYSRINQNGPEEMGWRTTAQNLNLNRDFLKADAPEMQHWLTLYHSWLPEFFADCHVTDGADYQYVITYKIDQHGILDRDLVQWVENAYLKELKPAMKKSGFPLMEYVYLREWQNLLSGMITWASPPRFSDGYTALNNRPGLLVETHMFKDYKTRVSATYEILKHTLSILNHEYQNLIPLVKKADAYNGSKVFRENPFPITFKRSADSTMIQFKSYKIEQTESDLSGGVWYRYLEDTMTYTLPFFNKMEPDITVMLPEAYLVPPQWEDVLHRIRLHGIRYNQLKEKHQLEVYRYRFSNPEWREQPYEGRHTLTCDMEEVAEKYTYPAGTAVISMNQPRAKVIAHILEPKAPDSFVHWGFFDTIFEKKEYAEAYVMEERARLMLASDPKLEAEFESKMKADSSFASDPTAILNWFYMKSPYWDEEMNAYPVGRLYDQNVLNTLEFE